MRRDVVVGAMAALAAALAGGVAWGVVTRATERRIPAVALAIGLLAGGAAAVAARRSRGVQLQAAAVAATLVGVVVGKYLGYAWEAQEIGARFGLETVGIHSTRMMRAFLDDLDYVFGWIDVLWIGLAVAVAVLLTKRNAPGDGAI